MSALEGSSSNTAGLTIIAGKDSGGLVKPFSANSTGGIATTSAAPGAADVLSGSTNAAGTIITIPAGRTWRGTLAVSAALKNEVAGAAVTASAHIATAGVGVVPPAGAHCRVNIAVPAAAATATIGHAVSGHLAVTDFVVVAPAGNSVTLDLVQSSTTAVTGMASGVLL